MNIKELEEQAFAAGQREYGMKKFAELVAAHEREECAKVVDHILKEGGGTYGDAIRARGKA